MTYARKVDTNHAEIRRGIRACGYVWYDTFRIGEGFPDGLVVTKRGYNVLFEVKMPGEPLTGDEPKFHHEYKAKGGKHLFVIHSVEEALAQLEWIDAESEDTWMQMR